MNNENIKCELYDYLSDIVVTLEDTNFFINLEEYQIHHFLLSIYTFILFDDELNMFYGVLLSKVPTNYHKTIIKILYERTCSENNKIHTFEKYFKQFCDMSDTMYYDYYTKNSLRIPIDDVCTELCKIICDKSWEDSIATCAAIEFILCRINLRLNDYAKCKLEGNNKIILNTNNKISFDLLLSLENQNKNMSNMFVSLLNTTTLFKNLFEYISQIFKE